MFNINIGTNYSFITVFLTAYSATHYSLIKYTEKEDLG